MRVQLTDKYFVSIDKLDVTLYRIQETDKTKKNVKSDITEKLVGYYPNIKSAIRRAIDDSRTDMEDCSSLEEYLKKLEEHDARLMTEIEQKYNSWKVAYVPRGKGGEDGER